MSQLSQLRLRVLDAIRAQIEEEDDRVRMIQEIGPELEAIIATLFALGINPAEIVNEIINRYQRGEGVLALGAGENGNGAVPGGQAKLPETVGARPIVPGSFRASDAEPAYDVAKVKVS
jgi:hypothetical protein